MCVPLQKKKKKKNHWRGVVGEIAEVICSHRVLDTRPCIILYDNAS